MWDYIKAYLLGRWAEPETKVACTTATSVTVAWAIGHLGLAAGPSTDTVIMTDVSSVIVALLPGPISSAIIQQLFGKNTPPKGALMYRRNQP